MSLMLVRFLFAKTRSQRGFTLVEALVAVIVVGILITALTPLLVFSVAARVQARRVDLASQAGRSYIDAVRSGAISVAGLPNTGANKLVTDYATPLTTPPKPVKTFEGIDPPDPANYLTSAPPGVNIDGDGDGQVGGTFDFIIQPMRTRIIPDAPATDEPATVADRDAALRRQGFLVGVRVYRADAFGSAFSPTLYKGLGDPQCSNSRGVFIGSLGNRACPIVVMRAEIFPTISPDNISEIKKFVGN